MYFKLLKNNLGIYCFLLCSEMFLCKVRIEGQS